ncbi:MAG TPA: hypothetical protein PLU49_12750 [Saprospiraceae bacterium]|nr:hypothetical protein [Saprospiraceae bacterium]
MSHQENTGFDYQGIEAFFTNGNLWHFIWKRKISFLLTLFIAAVLSVIFSGPRFITPKYKSVGIVYPINLTEYSEESYTEQMLQTFQSDDIKFRLINAFDLYKVYKIDSSDQHAHTYIFDEINDHVTFGKTPLQAVKVQVMDKDPRRAAKMVDSLVSFYDQLIKYNRDIRHLERVNRGQKEMNKIQSENDSLQNILTKLREESNLISPQLQTKEITRAYFSNNRQAALMYQKLSENKEKINFLDSLISLNNARFMRYKSDHDEQLGEMDRQLTFSTFVSKPMVPDKKSYPVRWVILVISVFSAALFWFLVMIITSNIRRTNL